MRGILHTTASSIKAILCYIDAEKTPKIAFDKNEYAIPLANKLKEALGESDGSQPVMICFRDGEEELVRQFNGVCGNIQSAFDSLVFCTRKN